MGRLVRVRVITNTGQPRIGGALVNYRLSSMYGRDYVITAVAMPWEAPPLAIMFLGLHSRHAVRQYPSRIELSEANPKFEKW